MTHLQPTEMQGRGGNSLIRRLWAQPYLDKPISLAFHAHKFWKIHGYVPNVIRPSTYSEKILYKMVFDRRPILSRVADKVEVRDFVADRVGNRYLTKIYAVFDDPRPLHDFSFPSAFVLKASHGSNWNHFQRPSDRLDVAELVRKASLWLNDQYSWLELEWCYASIPARLLVEEYLGPEAGVPTDYKFHCFNGRVGFIQEHIGRYSNDVRINLYDREWTRFGVEYAGFRNTQAASARPANLEEMVRVAETLSAGFDFIRVDLYDLGNRVVFGELTNYPMAFYAKFEPVSFDQQFGTLWTVVRSYSS